MRYLYTGAVPVELGDGRLIQPGQELELLTDPGRPDFEPVAKQPVAAERPERKERDE